MASNTCRFTVNGKTYKAHIGDTLMDAGLENRIVLPHDCCSGQCESCRVTVISGDVEDYGTREKNTVMGCLATLQGDAEIAYDPVPIVKKFRGWVEAVEEIAEDLLEVRVRTNRSFPWLPGQYVRMTFKGFPPRDYSPTFALDLAAEERLMVFHIRVYPNGQISGALGKEIREGHRVVIVGPYGNAFLRRQNERMILVSTGTGFAPIWSIAVAGAMGQPNRRIEVIAGAREKSGLYFGPAVEWLKARNIPVKLTASDGDDVEILRERPPHYLPQLVEDDIVYAAGAPNMVERVRSMALQANATFYADPFYAADPAQTLLRRLIDNIRPTRKPRPAEASKDEERVA